MEKMLFIFGTAERCSMAFLASCACLLTLSCKTNEKSSLGAVELKGSVAVLAPVNKARSWKLSDVVEINTILSLDAPADTGLVDELENEVYQVTSDFLPKDNSAGYAKFESWISPEEAKARSILPYVVVLREVSLNHPKQKSGQVLCEGSVTIDILKTSSDSLAGKYSKKISKECFEGASKRTDWPSLRELIEASLTQIQVF